MSELGFAGLKDDWIEKYKMSELGFARLKDDWINGIYVQSCNPKIQEILIQTMDCKELAAQINPFIPKS